MSYEQKELTGALFEKHDKEGRQPDFTGNVKIEGKEWRLAGWWTESRNGETYMSLKVTDPEEFRRNQQRQDGGRGMDKQSFEKRRQEIRERAKQNQADMKSRAAGDFGADLTDDDIPF